MKKINKTQNSDTSGKNELCRFKYSGHKFIYPAERVGHKSNIC